MGKKILIYITEVYKIYYILFSLNQIEFWALSSLVYRKDGRKINCFVFAGTHT